MIQLFLRHTAPRRFTTLKQAPTVRTLLKHYQHFVDQIPEEKRYQVSYTIHNCTDNDREFLFSTIYAIDIDDIAQTDLENKIPIYINVVANTLGVPSEALGVVDSGYGLHLVVQHNKFTTDKWFKANAHHNEYYCAEIDSALQVAGLSGQCDRQIFHKAAMLRLPNTLNRHPKKERPDRMATLIQEMGDTKYKIDITKSPATEKKDEVPQHKLIATAHNAEPDQILKRCAFIRSFEVTPDANHEPQWYAMLSIAGRMGATPEEGVEWAHKLSSYHPRAANGGATWKGHDTETKLRYQMDKAGPRTCEWIKNNCDTCTGCPEKVATPLLLVSPDTIATEHTGFHNIFGKTPKPEYDDLRRYFEREKQYKCLGDTKVLYVYTGTHYQEMGEPSLNNFAYEAFQPKATLHMKAEFRSTVLDTNLRFDEFWTPKNMVNFHNGILNTKTNEFTSHSPDHGFRFCLPYEYDPTATAPLFTAFLDRVTGGDKDTQALLLEYMGYALSNDPCWTQKCLLLTGDGANGKSTFLDVLTRLAGRKSYSSINMDDLNRSEYARQMLDGKLFNVSEETPSRALLNSSLFKNLVTGGEITVRAIYKQPYSIISFAKLIFTCNELPATSDNTYGFWRRMLPVHFDQTFTKDSEGFDPHLATKLADELPGIYNMVLEGYRRLQSQVGFTDAKKVADTLEEYRMENDTVSTWVTDALIVHKNGQMETHFESIPAMYAAYRETIITEGRKPVAQNKFAKLVRKMPASFWGAHSVKERDSRKVVRSGDTSVRARGLKGVQLRH